MRTRVLVNLTWLVPGVVGGSEESTTNALRAVLADAPDDLELRLAVLEPFLDAHPDLAAGFACEVLRLDGRDKLSRVVAEQSWLAWTARKEHAQVVHHAGGVVPLVHPGRVVLTIHDLQPLDLAENFSVAKRTYIRTMIGRSARAAEVICVPSEFTRDRVVDLLGIDPDRVVVVPWSLTSGGAPWSLTSGGVPDSAVSGSDIALPTGPFLLYPAVTYAHKNHLMLLDAFAGVAAEDPDVALVLTGGVGPLESEVLARIGELGLGSRVYRTGRVPAAVLDELYRTARATVVPSRYEGFGLPALEAMAHGCPVIVADAGSLPEVARAEDLVDPDDVTAWTAAMQAVAALSDSARARRVADGRAVAARFTSDQTARALLDSYRRAAHGPPHPPRQ